MRGGNISKGLYTFALRSECCVQCVNIFRESNRNTDAQTWCVVRLEITSGVGLRGSLHTTSHTTISIQANRLGAHHFVLPMLSVTPCVGQCQRNDYRKAQVQSSASWFFISFGRSWDAICNWTIYGRQWFKPFSINWDAASLYSSIVAAVSDAPHHQ